MYWFPSNSPFWISSEFIKEVEKMDLAKYIKLNCKKMDKAEGEEIVKIIKNIETDEDDEGVELILEKNEMIQLKI